MKEYGKVFSRIWESADFRSLTEDGRALVLYLLTCQHGTIAGTFRVPDGYACEDLQWSAERVSQGFRNLDEKGFATRCAVTKWVWVRKFLEWNPPENPNQIKAIVKVAGGVPDQCGWKRHFLLANEVMLGIPTPPEQAAGDVSEQTVSEPFGNPSSTSSSSSSSSSNQESNLTVAPGHRPDDRPASDCPAKPKPPGLPECPHLEILALWAEVLPTLPQHLPSQWKGARADHLRARWRETAADKGWQTREQGLAYFRRLFAYVGESDFLSGKVARHDGNRPFVATLEWLVQPEKWGRTHEGRYHQEVTA